MKKQDLLPVLAFCGIAAAYCLPVFFDLHKWGQMEWDQFTFWNAVPRDTLLRFGQFPLWNPYANGGNVLLAHPHSPFLSPFYLFVLIFGPVIGLKLQIFVFLVIGLWGMYALGRDFLMERLASCCSAFVFMLSSIYALHLTEGHTEWLVMAFLPWVLFFFLKAVADPRQVLGVIICLSLMIFGGSVDVISITVAFLAVYAVFWSIQLGRIDPLVHLSIVLCGTFLLCAVKLLPMLEFLGLYPRLANEHNGIGFKVVGDMLFGRQQAYWDTLNWKVTQQMGLRTGWHEYGAYVGVLPFALAVWGAVRVFKDRWPLIVTGIIFLFIALGTGAPVNMWYLLHEFPFYDSFKVPWRYILGVVFCIAIFSGIGFSWVERTLRLRAGNKGGMVFKHGAGVVLVVILLDLFSVNAPILRHAFTIEPLEVVREDIFRQRYQYINFFEKDQFRNIVGEEISNSSMYPVFLSNSGVLEGNEVVNIPLGDVRAMVHPQYRGEVYLEQGMGETDVEYFSPNQIIVNLDMQGPDTLIVNQNYYAGWMVAAHEHQFAAKPLRGLIATAVGPGESRVVFYYQPVSFLRGIVVSVLALCVFLYSFVLRDWFGSRLAWLRRQDVHQQVVLDNKKLAYLSMGVWGMLLVLNFLWPETMVSGLFRSVGPYSFLQYLSDIAFFLLGSFAIFLLPGMVWLSAIPKGGRSPIEYFACSFVLSVVMLFILTSVLKVWGGQEIAPVLFTGMLAGLTAVGVGVCMRQPVLTVNLPPMRSWAVIAGLLACVILGGWVFQERVVWLDYDQDFSEGHVLQTPLGTQSDVVEIFGLADSLKRHFLPYWDLEYADRFGYAVVDPPLSAILSFFLISAFGNSYAVLAVNALVLVALSFALAGKIGYVGVHDRYPARGYRILFLVMFSYLAVILADQGHAWALIDHIHWMTLFVLLQFYFLLNGRKDLFLVFAGLAFLTKFEAAIFTLGGLGAYYAAFRADKKTVSGLCLCYLAGVLIYFAAVMGVSMLRGDIAVHVKAFFIERLARIDHLNILTEFFSDHSPDDWGSYSLESAAVFLVQLMAASAFFGILIFMPQTDARARFLQIVAAGYLILILLSKVKRVHYLSPLVMLSVVIAIRAITCGVKERLAVKIRPHSYQD